MREGTSEDQSRSLRRKISRMDDVEIRTSRQVGARARISAWRGTPLPGAPAKKRKTAAEPARDKKGKTKASTVPAPAPWTDDKIALQSAVRKRFKMANGGGGPR